MSNSKIALEHLKLTRLKLQHELTNKEAKTIETDEEYVKLSKQYTTEHELFKLQWAKDFKRVEENRHAAWLKLVEIAKSE